MQNEKVCLCSDRSVVILHFCALSLASTHFLVLTWVSLMIKTTIANIPLDNRKSYSMTCILFFVDIIACCCTIKQAHKTALHETLTSTEEYKINTCTSDCFKFWNISEAYSEQEKMSLLLSMSRISGAVSFAQSKSSSSLESMTIGESAR